MKKLKHSFATTVDKEGNYNCDLIKLAKSLKNWGEIPIRLNNTKAIELSLLAKAFLDYDEILSKELK